MTNPREGHRVQSVQCQFLQTPARGQGSYEWWPEREERLQILADLFPDAEGHIVIDDLELGHVDGWEHYHAWDFLEHVRHGEFGLSVPPVT